MERAILILLFGIFTKTFFAQHAPFANFTPSANSYIDYGRGLNLDCINDLNLGNKVTITMWVRWTNKGDVGVGNWANLFTLADSVNNGDNGIFWVQHNSDNTKFEFALHTNSREYIQSTTNPQNNQWYFLVLVYDGSLPDQNMKLFVDGVLESTMSKTGNIRSMTNASRLNMGRWPNPGNSYRHFNGKMDEVSIWKTALSSVEIIDMMNNPELVTGSSYDAYGLIGYWNFDNFTADDLSVCGNNGLIGGGTSLPVTLTTLTAEQFNSSVNLKWSTSSEINNSEFIIERSINGIDFEEIGSVKGAGNSNRKINYSFSDYKPYSGISYYRLLQVDYNGKQSLSRIVDVEFNQKEGFLISIFPNPTKGSNIKIIANSELDEWFKVSVYDLSGREIYSSSSNSGTIEISADSFKDGIFIVKAISSEKTTSVKLIKN